MLRVNYGGNDRDIPVPTTLHLPKLDKMPLLVLTDHKLREIISACCVSDLKRLKDAHSVKKTILSITADYPHFGDELSRYLSLPTAQFDANEALSRCALEFRVARKLSMSYQNVDGILVDGLKSLVQQIHRDLRAGQGAFRTTPVSIKPDASGNVVRFPHHSYCDTLISSLEVFLKSYAEQFPAVSSLVAFVGVVHAHPFLDGNGRTARTLYNALMMIGCRSGHFMPISLLAYLSEGGFILKLRRAMYGHEWEKIALFFCNGLELSNRLQMRDSRLFQGKV